MIRGRTVVLFALIVCATSGRATAATFEVTSCADHALASAPSFAHHNSSSATLATDLSCSSAPTTMLDGLVAAARLGSGNTAAGASASWSTSAAPGTAIVAIDARRYLGKRDNDWHVWMRTAEGTLLESCEIFASLSCTVGALPTSPQSAQRYSGLSTSSVAFGVSCRVTVGECVGGTTLHSAWAIVYGMTVTVDDPSPPEIVTVAGPAISGGATGPWHAGVEDLSAVARDASGVRQLQVLVDGSAAGDVRPPCDYSRMRPCPPEARLETSVRWDEFSDGVHAVAVEAVDAAGQRQRSRAVQVPVDVHPPRPPEDLQLVVHPDQAVGARWRNPLGDAGAPVAAAHYEFCPSARGGPCQDGGRIAGANIDAIDRIRPPAGRGPWDLVVWLQDAVGHHDRAQSSRRTFSIDAVDVVPPPHGDPAPRLDPAPAPEARPAPRPQTERRPVRVRVLKVERKDSRLIVRGQLLPAVASGRVLVALRDRNGGRLRAQARAAVRHGRFAATLRPQSSRLPAAGTLRVRYAGNGTFAPAEATRPLWPPRRNPGG